MFFLFFKGKLKHAKRQQEDSFPTSASRLRIQIKKQTKPNDMQMDDGDMVRRIGGKKREGENLVEQYRDT